jgi:ubiquinone/menaquinone biosynthesis C-methylase UbiE
VTDRETRRLSFGSVATDYDRYRPSPPPQALDWLIPPGAQAVLDLAAGTGAVTRELVGRVPRVIAVERRATERGDVGPALPGHT